MSAPPLCNLSVFCISVVRVSVGKLTAETQRGMSCNQSDTIHEITRNNTNQIWCGFGFRVSSCYFVDRSSRQNSAQKKAHVRFLLLPLLFLFLGSSSVLASLSEKEARKLISRMAGAQLATGAVRIKRITETNSGAEATAEIETAFRLVQNEQRYWQVAEVRTGQDRWEEISLIAAAAKRQLLERECAAPDLSPKTADGVVSAKRARCLIASLLKIELPSDAVRIRDISNLGLPFTSSPSALVVALVQVDVRFSKEKGNWRISELRTGGGDWISIDATLAAINEEKRKRAQKELATLARALEAFRQDSGFYVASDKHPVLIDHLSPRYLAQIIRLDPWHNPYRYQGERDRFLLLCNGPDGQENTPDDIVVKGSPRASSSRPLN